MGFFGEGKYTDRDGNVHRVKDIPEFGKSGSRGVKRVSGDQAAVDVRMAEKKLRAQTEAEMERQRKMKAKKAVKKAKKP